MRRLTSAVAKHQKKPKRRSTALSGIWLWVTVAVVVIAALYMLARTLATTTQDVPPTPFLSIAQRDLALTTRLLGDVTVPAGQPGVPAGVDSLIAGRLWEEAVARIRKQLKGNRPGAPATRMRLGLCLYNASSPDRALREFRLVLADSSADPLTLGRAAFNAAYLFQSRGFADSALGYYRRAEEASADSADALLPALFNNTGVAFLSVADSAAALERFLRATAHLDTAADNADARILRDNLRRLAR